MKAEAVRYADVEALHRSLSSSTPFQANRVVALVSRIFSLAIKWEIVDHNPAKGIERNQETPRSRYLDRGELAQLLEALSTYPDQRIANAVRLLLMTGARKGEVLSARWYEFDLDGGFWAKPAATTKQARTHRVPLSGTTLELLRAMRKTAPNDEFLFPGPDQTKPITDIKKSWDKIRKAANLDDLRLHDLRHTYASHLVSAGSTLPIVGALLGHTQAQTTNRYAHLLDDPLREATQKIGELIADLDAPGD